MQQIFYYRKFHLFLIFLSCIFITFVWLFYIIGDFYQSQNYFMQIHSISSQLLLINTTFCKILNLPPNHPSIQNMLWKLPSLNCDRENRHWTYAEGEVKQAYPYYEQHHAFALPRKNSKTEGKIEFWKNSGNSKTDRPPNVIVVGIDSTSRLSFIRNMPKTREFLEKNDGIEFLGYTKVGDNTFRNLVPLLSGYSMEDLGKICYFNNTSHQDFCPYIWHDFDKVGYLTGEIEDGRTFNYLTTGFVNQPTDYYFRPFILGLAKHGSQKNIQCTGYEKSIKTFLTYIKNLIKMSRKDKVPLFLLSWATELAHDDINGAQLGDQDFEDFFKFVVTKLENTFLIFLSDHGYRFGEIKNSISGWFEEKLPFLWFLLSSDLKKKYPNWVQNLQMNSGKLTTPYDLHKTLVQILNSTSNYTVSVFKNSEKFSKFFGQSLISHSIPKSRKCSDPDVGIPDIFCACSPPRKDNLPLLGNFTKAAEKAVEKINSFLPKICFKLSLESIVAGTILENFDNLEYEQFVVSFYTNPGHFQFEAHLRYYPLSNSNSTRGNEGTFEINSQILRTNRFSDGSCINDPYLELYCFC